MNEKKPINLSVLFLTLGVIGTSLILTGGFLGFIFDAFKIEVPSIFLYIAQAVFIFSGLADFWLIKYAKDKLS